MASEASRREAEEWGHALRHRGIIQGCRERRPRIEWPRSDDPRGSFLPDSREGSDGRERCAVHVERVFDRREGSLTVARHAHVDESIQRRVVRDTDEDRIGADLPAVCHVTIVNLQEHVPQDRSFRNYAAQRLVVHRGPDGLLELPEFTIQSGRLELAPHRAHLTDVDPADPQILLAELLEEREVQAERLLRLPVEARDDIEARETPGHRYLAALAPECVDHPDRREASVRAYGQVVPFRHT